MAEHGIPYTGVQEVRLLHDVIEDTEFTMDDVEGIYSECGFKDFFEMYVKDALIRITHDKSQDYETYIDICLGNPISAIAKMMDLQDNLRVIDLVSLDDEKLKRSFGYLKWIAVINVVFHFLEGVESYKKEFHAKKNENGEDSTQEDTNE